MTRWTSGGGPGRGGTSSSGPRSAGWGSPRSRSRRMRLDASQRENRERPRPGHGRRGPLPPWMPEYPRFRPLKAENAEVQRQRTGRELPGIRQRSTRAGGLPARIRKRVYFPIVPLCRTKMTNPVPGTQPALEAPQPDGGRRARTRHGRHRAVDYRYSGRGCARHAALARRECAPVHRAAAPCPRCARAGNGLIMTGAASPGGGAGAGTTISAALVACLPLSCRTRRRTTWVPGCENDHEATAPLKSSNPPVPSRSHANSVIVGAGRRRGGRGERHGLADARRRG